MSRAIGTANTAATLSKKGGKHNIKKAVGGIPPTAIMLKHKKIKLLGEQ
ncbi:hypothetical protein YPPY15_2569 [Yersinia pestis PY-15]|nr:hypothetical protein YPPY02_2571 [Yersinia pestis PY-02]EIR17233.1 hypothetical protein YPPY07_2500 [Yersinia pestis PY-07]EIR46964.1 hypothetical protein YPPY15_2569 [Yersinia pestis PY-15]EIS05682.1 hypothetical protein YPPY48_2637 [Yersinia pestis PY-48]EIS24653.1 hypothetical protein YPPY54_2669 [Yersinia pestis PY-54]EIS78807.1 hypothetical protein YPPY72_2634 [Yersinia pestis PY-72]EIT15496.1 hypothetical protein YPPY92_2618 [Yersinia pestis PY-92]EIT58502.1 hypothetical protein YPP